MKLNVGDKVRLLNEHGEGVVKKVLSKEEIWIDLDGFDYPYPIYELIKVDENNRVDFVSQEKKNAPDVLISSTVSKFNFTPNQGALSNIFKKLNPRGIPEIDLHIEYLTDDYKLKLDKREALQFQLEYLRYIIEEAEKNTVRELIIIHGKGEGVLKNEVRKLLSSMAHIELWDGTYQFYGSGATHIKIYY